VYKSASQADPTYGRSSLLDAESLEESRLAPLHTPGPIHFETFITVQNGLNLIDLAKHETHRNLAFQAPTPTGSSGAVQVPSCS
jgi:hypothetical protein